MLKLTIGQDLSCYATVLIPEDTPLTREALTKIVDHVVQNLEWRGEQVRFEEDWSTTCAARVVGVYDESRKNLVEYMAIDPSPFDAGQILMGWLRGNRATFDEVIKSAAKARIIDEPVMELHRGTLTFPGVEPLELEFEVRKGATREEKDLAFFEALAQIGMVDYVAIGEVHHGV
jgi:hypothetical protein